MILKSRKITVKRHLPKNINKGYLNLFNHELEINIPKPKIKVYKNIYYYNKKLYKFKVFLVLSKHWKMSEYKTTQKLKILVKNLFDITKLLKNKNKVIKITEAVFFTDEKSHRYFHWMCDSIPRLELMKQKNLIEEKYLLIDSDLYKNNFVKETLKLYGSLILKCEKDQIFKINKIYIPFNLANSGNYNPEIIKKIRTRYKNNFVKNSKFISNKKIWISRQNARIRKISNFFEIEKLLNKYDFEIFEFENIDDFSKHVTTINEATVIGGIHGAGMSNMLFLNEGSKVVEIRGENDNHNNAYFSLSSALNLDYYFFPAVVENDDFYHNDYYVDPLKFEELLKTL